MREYIIVNDTPSQSPRFLAHGADWPETAHESEARRFDVRAEARREVQYHGKNRAGWRVVQAPFF